MQDFFSTRSIPFSPENFKSTRSGKPHEFNMLTEIGPTRADGSQPVERTRDFLLEFEMLRRLSMSARAELRLPARVGPAQQKRGKLGNSAHVAGAWRAERQRVIHD